jgi:hypothetical protein
MDENVLRQIEIIKNSSVIPEPPPLPSLPDLHHSLSTIQKLQVIQRYISAFQYNFSGQPFVKMQKSRGMIHISSCAQEIIRVGLPIQCIEAVFLACFLTSSLPTVDRIPISFKSKCGENIHRHIVLGLRHNGKWGSIGISRRTTLMGKDCIYDSLSDLVLEFKKCYEQCYHHLITVYVGLPFSHDVFCDMPIKWRALRVNTRKKVEKNMIGELEIYSASMMRTFEYFAREGVMPSDNGKKSSVPKFRNPQPQPRRRRKSNCNALDTSLG